MTFYKEVALGGASNRGRVIMLDSIPNEIKKAQSLKLPLYISYYNYDESLIHHFKTKSTMRGYKGNQYLDGIKFDIDKGTNTDDFTLHRVKIFYERLIDDYDLDDSNIAACFSGRGYHITIPNIFGFTDSPILYKDMKLTLTKYFPEADDIYDSSRLLRAMGTVNERSNKYKIQLTREQLFGSTSNEILELATKPQNIFSEQYEVLEPKYSNLIVVDRPIHTETDNSTSNIVTCMQHCYNEGGTQGSRHIKMLRLASAFRRAGVPKEGIKVMLAKWAPTLEYSEVDTVVNSVYKNDYKFSCKDSVMAHYCDKKCIYHAKKNYTLDIVAPADMEKSYMEFIRSDFTKRSFDLADAYNVNSFRCYPGELVVLLGDTGLGKSAWIQNLCILYPHLKILYLSLEMHQHLTYRRFIQIAHNMTKEQIEEHYRSHTNSLSQKMGHIHIATTSPELSSIAKIIGEGDYNLVVVDVVDAISYQNAGHEDKLGPIGEGLKEIAQSTNSIIIGIHHISKSAAYESSLTVHSGKGSSTIEQKADKVIGIEGKQIARFRTIKSLKARDENPFQMTLEMLPETFRFQQIK